jgi:hypothetical protein
MDLFKDFFEKKYCLIFNEFIPYFCRSQYTVHVGLNISGANRTHGALTFIMSYHQCADEIVPDKSTSTTLRNPSRAHKHDSAGSLLL